MHFLKKGMIGIAITAVVLVVVIYLFQQQPSFGDKPSGKRLERILKSPQYKNGSFNNFSTTPMMAEDASYFKLLGMYLWNKIKTDPNDSLPSKLENYNLPISGKPVITWFGHSSYLIQCEKMNILVDPVFSKRASPVQYAGSKGYLGTSIFNLDILPQIDVVLISHDHYDHLDYETMLHLKSFPIKFYVPLGLGAHLEYWGIPESNITEFDWWQNEKIGEDLEIIATPARHFSGRGLMGRNQTLWTSFVLKNESWKLFIGGDSGYDTHFKEIGNKFGPFDLAILECGQYNTYWPYIHMMPEQTAQAALDLNAKVLLPVHWSKFTLALHPWKEPIQRVTIKAKEINLKVTTPMLGEKIIIDGYYPENEWWNSIQ